MQASTDKEQTSARLEEELQKKEDTIKQQEQYISQLKAKRDDLTSNNETSRMRYPLGAALFFVMS